MSLETDFEAYLSNSNHNSPQGYHDNHKLKQSFDSGRDNHFLDERRDSFDISLAQQEAEDFFEDEMNIPVDNLSISPNKISPNNKVNNNNLKGNFTQLETDTKSSNLGDYLNKNKSEDNFNMATTNILKDKNDNIVNNKHQTLNKTVSAQSLKDGEVQIDNIDDETSLANDNIDLHNNVNEIIRMKSSKENKVNTLNKAITENSHDNSMIDLNSNNNVDKNLVKYRNHNYNDKNKKHFNNRRKSENITELKTLQEKYSKAIVDFKLLRNHLSENMEKNLMRTENLQHYKKTSEQYKSLDNILRVNKMSDLNEPGGTTNKYPSNNNVEYRNKNRYSSQDNLYKRHSDFLDERLRTASDTFYRPEQQETTNSPLRQRHSMHATNNNYAHYLNNEQTYNYNPNSLENREHQLHLRDQAAKTNFERYLKGTNFLSSSSHPVDSIIEDSDNGYGGSGSTSPRDLDPVIPTDQLSSRSGSTRSHNSRASSALASVDSGVRMSYIGQHNSLVVVAIDFGTTFSGYAFSFTRDSGSIHMMRRWEGGDPGVTNQKTPTTLLLKPDGSFHSFGFGARDFYHDLDANDARKWLYFDKFKMALHATEDLHAGLEIKAANGKSYPALKVFSHALKFFKDHVLQELFNQSTAKLSEEDITWVLTVPAIWRQQAKQFMRTAAYEAGIASLEHPDRLLIALEPEAASIFCRKLRIRDCVIEDDLKAKVGDDSLISEDFQGITQYIVVDCGGGTVDLTVHELDVTQGTLKELHKGTGGPCGATGVDREFEKLLVRIFDHDFIQRFKEKRPAVWIDLMIAFEAKKRTARPDNQSPLNLSLPFSFIEYHKKHRKCSVETAVKKYKNPDIKWSSQGMLRFSANVMKGLFEPVVKDIIGHIQNLLSKATLKHVEYLFLVGGFAESPLLQTSVRDALGERVRVIIPNDVGLAILKGAVLFGLDPTVVRVRRSAYTYGVGVLNKYDQQKHEQSKRVVKDGITWCKDIFDCFARVDESVGVGDRVTRSYAPARSKQKSTVINIYCTEKLDVLYTTDKGVSRCGKLRIEMPDVNPEDIPMEKRGKPRELQASMIFGDTEIKVSAVDVLSGRAARATIDFLNY